MVILLLVRLLVMDSGWNELFVSCILFVPGCVISGHVVRNILSTASYSIKNLDYLILRVRMKSIMLSVHVI